jgi:N-acyl-D-aspartate/D-glutamate deacylase
MIRKVKGVDVLGDVYPYNAGSTKLDNLMPAWAHDGGIAKLLERLSDRGIRRKIMDECLIDGERWGTAMSRVMAWDPHFGGSHGRAMKRAMAPGEFTRGEKEMVAAVVSGVNACEY